MGGLKSSAVRDFSARTEGPMSQSESEKPVPVLKTAGQIPIYVDLKMLARAAELVEQRNQKPKS